MDEINIDYNELEERLDLLREGLLSNGNYLTLGPHEKDVWKEAIQEAQTIIEHLSNKTQ